MKKVFETLLESCLAMLFVLIIICVALQVFYRYVLSDPLAWTEELAKLAFIWMIFLGLFLAERDNLHIAVDFFVDRLRPVAQRRIRILVETFSIAVLLLICCHSFGFIGIQKAMRSVGLNISLMYFTLAVPIGCLLFALYKGAALSRFVQVIQTARSGRGDG